MKYTHDTYKYHYYTTQRAIVPLVEITVLRALHEFVRKDAFHSVEILRLDFCHLHYSTVVGMPWTMANKHCCRETLS